MRSDLGPHVGRNMCVSYNSWEINRQRLCFTSTSIFFVEEATVLLSLRSHLIGRGPVSNFSRALDEELRLPLFFSK